MIPVGLLFGGGAAALLLLMLTKGGSSGGSRYEVSLNGRKWVLEKTGQAVRQVPTQAGMTSLVEQSFLVYAPKTTVSMEFPVLAFSQIGDNPASRKLTARYPNVPAGTYDNAMKDFAIKADF